MKLGIMQPYFFPYIGYWQLINAVDKFVIYDDVNFIKKGWINRNRIVVSGKLQYINLPVKAISQNKFINEHEIEQNERINRKTLMCIEASYRRAPYFNDVYPIVSHILLSKETNLVAYLENTFHEIANYLEINTEFVLSSNIEKDCSLKGEDKIIEICNRLKAQEYYNAIGGMSLYSKERFEHEKIALYFLEANEIVYKQFEKEFQPNLSIIDVLMFNSKAEVQEMLSNFKLI